MLFLDLLIKNIANICSYWVCWNSELDVLNEYDIDGDWWCSMVFGPTTFHRTLCMIILLCYDKRLMNDFKGSVGASQRLKNWKYVGKKHKLKGSMQAGPMWLFRSDFPSCSESAEIWHADSFFLWKNGRAFFSTSGETRLQTRSWKSTPPPPTNSIKYTCTVFWLSRIEILHCLETDREGGGGRVWIWRNFVHIFCILEKKTGRVDMSNFSWFWATWKIATK